MKKFFLLVFFLPTLTVAQGVSHTNTALYNSGGNARIVASAVITVCNASDPQTPCTTKISIFTNSTLTNALANPFNADANGNYSFYAAAGNYTVTVTGAGVIGYSYQISLLGGAGVNTPNVFTVPQAFNAALNANAGGALNGSFSGPTVLTGNLTATAGQNDLVAWRLDKFILVDGIHFAPAGSVSALCAGLGTVPSTGAVIIDTFVEAFTVNPFSCTSNPVWVQFGARAPARWTTTVPIQTGPNQWITGAGPQGSAIQAVAGYSSATLGLITLGNGTETHSSFARDLGLDCNGIAACTGLVFDGAQNPAGAENVNITNFTADGVRIQQTSAASSGIKLSNMWAYSVTGSAPTGSVLNVSQFSGDLLVENFTGQDDHAFPGAASFKVAGGSGFVTFINAASEGTTDQFLLTGTSATTVIIGAGQSASSSPGVNTVHVGAGVINYTLINVSQGNSTGAALVDDNRSYTCTGQITYLSVTGGSTRYDYGSCPTIGWIRTPATTVSIADLIQLQAGFVGSQKGYQISDNLGNQQFFTTLDGRIGFRGNQTGAFTQLLTSDTLTAGRTPRFPNGPSATVMPFDFTTVGATTSDVLTIQGMTGTGHCTWNAMNALAATGVAAGTTWIDTLAANTVTLHHTATNGQLFHIACTSN